MKQQSTSTLSKTDWSRLERMTDADIDFTDMPELTEDQAGEMRPGEEVMPGLKERRMYSIPVLLDSELVSAYVAQANLEGRGHHELIEAALWDYARNFKGMQVLEGFPHSRDGIRAR